MTVDAWLASRSADAPPHLMQRVRDALGPSLLLPSEQLPEAAVAAAGGMVSELLAQERTGRESALELLAADALVTFAFEAAADAPAELTQRAHAAMRTLSALDG